MRLPWRRGSHRSDEKRNRDVVGHAGLSFFLILPELLGNDCCFFSSITGYRRAPDRHDGTLRISGPSHRRAVSPGALATGQNQNVEKLLGNGHVRLHQR